MATVGNPEFYGQGILNDGTSQNSQAVVLTGKQLGKSTTTTTAFDTAPVSVFRRAFLSGSETQDIVLPYDCIVVDAMLIKTTAGEGTHASTLKLKKSTHELYSFALNAVADKAVMRIDTLDYNYVQFLAGETLSVVNAQGAGGNSDCQVIITVLKGSW